MNISKTSTHFDIWFDKKYGREYNRRGWQDLSMVFFLPLLWLFGYDDHDSFKQHKRLEHEKEFAPGFYRAMEPTYRKEGLL